MVEWDLQTQHVGMYAIWARSKLTERTPRESLSPIARAGRIGRVD